LADHSQPVLNFRQRAYSFLYSLGLYLLAIVQLPKWLYYRIVKGKYRDSWRQKWGRNWPMMRPTKIRPIWVHAVSMGETLAVIPLLRKIHTQRPDLPILFTTTTETGLKQARRSAPFVTEFAYLPFDFSWVIGPVVRQVNPSLILLTESDFWFHFLSSGKRCGASVVLVNGKISERSAKRFGCFKGFASLLFAQFDQLCVQNEVYKKRFMDIGVPSEKIVVTGNLKFDGEAPRFDQERLDTWRAELGIGKGDPVVVVGSSHAPEEKQLLEQMERVWQKIPNMHLILVPRHPERFEEVAQLLKGQNRSYMRYSERQERAGMSPSIVLMDQMGLLRQCYQVATVAIVAGSYVEHVGGHNVLEPAAFGVPTIFGPYMHSQKEMLDLMLGADAALQLPMEQVGEEVLHLLQNDGARKALGERGLHLLQSLHGSTDRTLVALSRITTI